MRLNYNTLSNMFKLNLFGMLKIAFFSTFISRFCRVLFLLLKKNLYGHDSVALSTTLTNGTVQNSSIFDLQKSDFAGAYIEIREDKTL